ncbi:MAG: hypothetical protein HC896_12490 [Bacteroidales bacterium]|nr:hypothetical protein [Bacteroidales bacterium]
MSKAQYYSANAPDAGKKISSDRVHVIFKDASGHIWLGTENGLDVMIVNTPIFRPSQDVYSYIVGQNFANNRIYSISQDRLDNLWIFYRKGSCENIAAGKIFQVYKQLCGKPKKGDF